MRLKDKVKVISDKAELCRYKDRIGEIKKIKVIKETRQKKYLVFFPDWSDILEPYMRECWFDGDEISKEGTNAEKVN